MKTNITRKYFESVSDFENWNDTTEDKDNIVTIIEEGGWYRVDFTTWCARPSTAIRRMFAQLRDIKDFTGWEECMIESIQSNYWHMNDMTMGDGSKNPYPSYSWGVEQLWEKTEDSPAYWYVFINIMTDALRFAAKLDERIVRGTCGGYALTECDTVPTVCPKCGSKYLEEHGTEPGDHNWWLCRECGWQDDTDEEVKA